MKTHKSLQRALIFVALAAIAVGVACGSSAEGTVTPNGDELCLGERKVCIVVPPGALEAAVGLRITQGTDAPPASLGEAFDISSTTGKPVLFLKPAKVTISLSTVDAGSVPTDTLLRIYTRSVETNEWVPLGSSTIDRVRREVTGLTTHLSPFVVLRADRLPDGTVPVEIDGGVTDSGVTVFPPVPDAGRPDAGRPDAGRPDGGASTPDAGSDGGAGDAGMAGADAGARDAGGGAADAGDVDAGQAPDAGGVDAGSSTSDAGGVDAGSSASDAGEGDAGTIDAG